MAKPRDISTYPVRYKPVLDFIIRYKQAHDGNSPTLREIATECNISSTSVADYILKSLETAGVIRLTRGDKAQARMIEVVGGVWSYGAEA